MEHTRSLGLFTERNGVHAAENVAAMLAEPEVYLSDQEKAELYGFAHDLFFGRLPLPDGTVLAAYDNPDTAKSLKQINDSKVEAQAKTFYLGAFSSAKGDQILAKMGMCQDSPINIIRQLADAESIAEKISPKLRREAADATHKWYVGHLTERLAQPKESDSDYHCDETLTINYDPDKLLDKIDDLQAYRRYYRAVYKSDVTKANSPSKNSSLLEAKQVLLDMHMAKVNGQLATLYPNAIHLARQLALSPGTERSDTWRQRLYASLPVIRLVFARENGYQAAATDMPRFSRRIDLLRNGAAHRGGPDFSPISQEVENLAETYTPPVLDKVEDALPEPISYKLKKARVTADQIAALLEAGLDSWELLSSERATIDQVNKRSGRAADGKWQVVIVPGSGKLDVAESKGVMNIGAEQKRSMADGIATGAHETTHVWQEEFAQKLKSTLPIASISGRRSLTGKEMGGVYTERQAKALLGQSRPTNFTYLRALQAKQAGANRLQAARASLESAVAGKSLSERELADQRRGAANRIERLYRHNGYNSQPLDYSEQELMLQALEHLSSEQVRAISIAAACFSFSDIAKLRRFGLIDLPTNIKINPAVEIAEIFKNRFMHDWLEEIAE